MFISIVALVVSVATIIATVVHMTSKAKDLSGEVQNNKDAYKKTADTIVQQTVDALQEQESEIINKVTDIKEYLQKRIAETKALLDTEIQIRTALEQRFGVEVEERKTDSRNIL